jgi:NDP-sugar pyrophosphorylase family protein
MIPSVAILMGGLGTRIQALSSSTPKSLIKIASRPFIDWQLDYLEDQGVQDVVLCLGHLGQDIENHIHNHPRKKLNIKLSYDGPKPLGTGGAIINALHLLTEDFFVIYGDSYFSESFSLKKMYEVYQQSSIPACMAIFHNQQNFDRSNVDFDQAPFIQYKKSKKQNSMEWIDYGISILSKKLLEPLPKALGIDLADFFQEISYKNQMIGFPATERFYEIGSYEGIAATETWLLQQKRNSC